MEYQFYQYRQNTLINKLNSIFIGCNTQPIKNHNFILWIILLMNKYLVVGLGNVGLNYVNTRHNIGFDILDQVSENYVCSFSNQK